HRRGPQDLPASAFLLGIVLAAYAAIALFALQITTPPPRAAGLLVFDTAFLMLAFWLVLRLFDKERRFLQTTTAMIGTSAFLNVVGVPLLLWNEAMQAPSEDVTAPRLLLLVLLLWSVDIGGYILSNALERPYILGVSIMLVYVLISTMMLEALFPVVG